MQKSVSWLYPTPLGEFQVSDAEDTNYELKQLILEKEKTEPSQSYANAGGWHSKTDLLDWPQPAVKVLQGYMAEAVDHMIVSTYQMMKTMGYNAPPPGRLQAKAWANISRAGNYHRTHNHPGFAWSGVYYVDVGSPAPEHPLSGLFEIGDPRPHANMVSTPGDPFGQRILIKPVPGKIVIFPSWLEHFVHPHFGEGTRISIAFNVRMA